MPDECVRCGVLEGQRCYTVCGECPHLKKQTEDREAVTVK